MDQLHQHNKPISSIEPIWTKKKPQFGFKTNPRIFDFSQSPKLIKLTNIYHEYINIGIKPNDQFQKKRIESTKIPILKSSENPTKMHEFMHENMKINAKGRYKGLTNLGRGKPCKKFGGKWKKNLSGALPSRRERKKVLKKLFEPWF